MGTKANPAPNDCYSRALPDEPLFTLLARDPTAPAVLKFWAVHREAMIARGDAPADDTRIIDEAKDCALTMGVWRTNRQATKDREAAWRTKREPTLGETAARSLLFTALSKVSPSVAEAIMRGDELTPLEHNAVEAVGYLLDAIDEKRNGDNSIFSRR